MKRIIALLLFCSLAFPFVGSYGWLLISKQLLKREIKQQILSGMAREHLVLLSFASADAIGELRWEHSSEFAYRGTMYDVVEQTIREDSSFFLCYPDHRESALNRKIATLVEQFLGNNPLQRENEKQVNRWLQVTFLVEPFSWKPVSLDPQQPPMPVLPASCLEGIHHPPDHPPDFS